ncbi:hypothetical protein JYU34_017926 [Plutella xylostella]|uniref:Uncharacterized protein n=1 Tax=Plutella xylostella TaxID=51655 RepID=A0ABQ7PZB9_PLUXY|nr:hypothetical protein JYU34_017926 [Plutella xylostella]
MSVQKNNGPLIDPGLCRCCRSIKKCRILTAEYTWMDQREVYSDMIMDCFGILLSHTDDSERDCGVCATCVVRLRDASSFRRQVLQSEEVFLQARLQYRDDLDGHDVEKKLLDLEPKLEPRDDASDHHSAREADDRSTGYLSDDHAGDLGLEPRDNASEHHSPGRERCTGDLSDDHAGVADVKSPKKEDIEVKPDAGLSTDTAPQPPPSDDDDDLPLALKAKKRVGKKTKTSKNGKIMKAKKKTAKVAKATAKKQPKLFKKQLEKKDTTERDLDYMAEENLLNIIENSYVVPFKNRRNNYYCYYCKDYYPKPEDLREHTITHDTKPFQLLMGYKKMPKLDITRIDCRLCTEKIDDINTFKSHIEQVHGKKIYSEAPDKLLLYKLTWNNLTCVMCSDVFEDFNGLNTHMVEHFSNYTCDVCGMCFLEKPRLDAHLKRHKDDEKHTCEICGKVFKSNHYKDMHVDIVHKKKAIIRCPRCDECFMSYALKNKHLTDAHGQKRVYPCNLCDKVYNRQKTLTEHQRRNHQKVLRHQCEYCEQRFYLPSRLKEHMATHTGERNFRCEYCEKSYPRLKSLQYHIRTHTNDRRYRCHICGQAFIQNASLKSHIKSHHPECEIEGCYF